MTDKIVVVIVTGGFDPLHSGHISYFKAARALGDILIVGVNSDDWLKRKKGAAFMPLEERRNILKALKMVDYVIDFNDSNDHSMDCIEKCRLMYPSAELIFANGGDRTADNIPEMSYNDYRAGNGGKLTFAFGVGGSNKINSSSSILNAWDKISKERDWGRWSVLKNYPNVKVKELTVLPGKSLSMQRHLDRSEFWFVAEGTATMSILNISTDEEYETIEQFSHTWIKKNQWHRLSNQHDTVLKIVEIQWGDRCEEDDIERIP